MTASPSFRTSEPSPDALCLLARQGRIRHVNSGFGRIVGCDPSVPLDRPFVEFVHPDDRAAVHAGLDAARSAETPQRFTCRLGADGGGYRAVECTLHVDAAGDQLFAVVRELAPGAPGDVLSEALQSSPCATAVVDGRGAIVMANREMERLFGYAEDGLVGQTVETLVPEGARERHVAHRDDFVAGGTARPMGKRRDLMVRRRDGSLFPAEVGLVPVRTAEGVYVVTAVVDLSVRREAERHITRQAEQLEKANQRLVELSLTDSLTGLRNRRAFLDQLEVQLEQACRTARPLSLLILDVDHFKLYNDEYGHLAGDEVLRGVAEVLREKARRSDYVARIGGEEFGVLLSETDRDGALLGAERFRSAIAARTWPLRAVTASVGATTATFSATRPRPDVPRQSLLLAEADRALYHSKDHGRNRVTHADELGTKH